MAGASTEPAYLDDAGTVSFRDVAHFKSEVEVNLLHGRALLRTRRKLGMNEPLQFRVVAPAGAGEQVLSGRVVFVQNDLVGLQLGELSSAVRSALAALVQRAISPPPPVVAPKADPDSAPSAAPEVDPEPPVLEATPPTPDVEGAARVPTGTIDVRTTRPSEPSGDVLPSASPSAPDAPPRESEAAPSLGSIGPRTGALLAERWPRLTTEGTVPLKDEAVALALYLLALRCGRIMLDVPPGPVMVSTRARFELNGRAAHVTLNPLPGSDVSGLFEVDNPAPLADLIEGTGSALAPLLTGVGLCATMDLGAASDDGAAVTGDLRSQTPEVPEPTPPRLDGHVVVFAHPSDLSRELETNVKNGGLFVESAPLPLRERVELQFRVQGRLLNLSLAADVVFADGGRVGFSFVDASAAAQRLEEAARSAGPRSGESGTLDVRAGGTTTLDIRIGTDDVVPPFSGRLGPPLDAASLLTLQRYRVSDPSQLERVSCIALFEYIVRSGWSGVLRLRADEGERDVHFYRGDVAFVSARPFEEHTSLGRILVAQRKVNETQLREALDRSRGSHRLLGRMLVLLGAIRKRDLSSALREQTRAKMESAFDWASGRYEWGPWSEPPGEADLVVTKGLSVIERYLRAQFDTLAFGELESLLGPSLGKAIRPLDIDALATGLRLSPRELRFVELQLDGTRSIHDAVMGSPLGRLGSLRLVAVGLALGLLEVDGGSAGVQVAADAYRESKAPRKSPREALEQRLGQRLQEIKAASYFEALGVHWSSHHREYRAAWEQARKEFDLEKPPLADAPEGVRKLAKEIIKELDLARDTLESKEKRIAYRKALFDKTERQYAAEMLLKQGEVALMRGDRMSAIAALETAAELSPSSKVLELLHNARERR